MAKYVIGIIALILIAAAGYWAWITYGGAPAEPEDTPPIAQEPTTNTYATSTFSASYPTGYTVDERYAFQFNEDKAIQGVKFTIPGTMATGTNLSADSGISVEWLPRAQNCTADIYLRANVRAEALTDAGMTYSVASSTEAAAGNRYEEIVYAYPTSEPCTAVRYFIHSTNIGNYEPGAVREFDRDALLREFDQIRRSISFGAQSATSSTQTP